MIETVKPELLGSSAVMAQVRQTLRQIASVNCRVLISGETGTGKEIAARSVHAASRRASRPFVVVNCPAIPETLFESELFGFERGAFSGAIYNHPGRLVEGDHGTVFLDEVGDLPLSVQAKLLRVMEHRELQRLGGRGTQTLDVRWIAATNRDLRAMVRGGAFRADLYYRLCVAEAVIPPLRNHKEDIPELAQHFARITATEWGISSAGFTPGAIATLEAHDWPGNLRELRNAVENSMLRADGQPIAVAHLPAGVTEAATEAAADPAERGLILEALERVHWNKSQAAKRLQWSRMTLYRKMAYYRIDQRCR